MSVAKLAILGMLMEKPMHGYELKQYLEERTGVFWMINYGSMYPTLKSLEKDGCVEWERDESIPVKKVYEITKRGEETFHDLLKERVGKEVHVRDEFTLHLFFLDYLSKKEAKNLLNAKREGNMKVLEELRSKKELASMYLSKFRFEALKRGIMHIETELKWLDELLEKEELR